MTTSKTPAPASWRTLLQEAVTEPGQLSDAYTAFHDYSLGNQLLALFQCIERGLPVGPIATYKGWQAKGRQVRRGEKALTLCMPVTVKKERERQDEPDVFQTFVYRRRWFTLAQTEGEDLPAPDVPSWDRDRALEALSVDLVPFAHLDGNCQGYASKRSIAINPCAAYPAKTTFHELAHVVLGHTAEGECSDTEALPRNLREVEAESVAYVLCTVLGSDGRETARAYVQGWLRGADVPEKNAKRILGAAQTILEAGRA